MVSPRTAEESRPAISEHMQYQEAPDIHAPGPRSDRLTPDSSSPLLLPALFSDAAAQSPLRRLRLHPIHALRSHRGHRTDHGRRAGHVDEGLEPPDPAQSFVAASTSAVRRLSSTARASAA